MKEHVGAATDAGLFVIQDHHVIGFPDGYYQKVPPEWDDPHYLYDLAFALAKDFWGKVSAGIKDRRVMFELWNEPVYRANEISPSDPNGSKWSRLKPYFNQLIGIIRGNGNRSVALATGNHWAYNLKGIKDDLLKDPNTAYSWHVYAGQENNDPARWAVALDELHRVKPVLVTEWGFEPGAHYRGTARTFANKFRDRFFEGIVWGESAYDYLQTYDRNPVRP